MVDKQVTWESIQVTFLFFSLEIIHLLKKVLTNLQQFFWTCVYLGKASSLVSHPPHLTNSWTSSFIPFCAYNTDLNISKDSPSLDGTDFPLCTSLLPTVLEGQRCYKMLVNETSGQGKRNELMLFLDYNEDRSLQVSVNEDKLGEKFSFELFSWIK